LRGSLQRLVLAPVDGFIATAPVRPGDVVVEGAVLATLDDHALSLEVAKWQAEYDQTLNEYREALSLLDSSKVTTLRASLDRSLAELALAEDNLARSEIRAPIAGFVVSGDLSQSLGAPVERGATLFELAPLDDYHVSVRVPEDDVGLLAPGQTGRLVLEALPGDSLAIVVERVTPVSEVVDGRNVFEVEARLVDSRDVLRPGMQGAAKVDVGEARLIWLWTHDIVDWLRLKLWALGLWG
jgi:multidrug efflux pump subunit AcrA (membrane-fusion protein)